MKPMLLNSGKVVSRIIAWSAIFLVLTMGRTNAHPTAATVAVLRIGPSKIMCFKQPCPALDGMAINRTDRSSPHPLYQGALPGIWAKRADRERIQKAWRSRACLDIIGRLESYGNRQILVIQKILHAC